MSAPSPPEARLRAFLAKARKEHYWNEAHAAMYDLEGMQKGYEDELRELQEALLETEKDLRELREDAQRVCDYFKVRHDPPLEDLRENLSWQEDQVVSGPLCPDCGFTHSDTKHDVLAASSEEPCGYAGPHDENCAGCGGREPG